MRVLIIDDDPDLRNLLVQYIRQQWPAGDIAEYDPLQRDLPGRDFPLQSYDVIILDYMLGRGDGLRWLEELKKRPKCPPIIFLTGAGSEIIAVRAMKLGAADYQRKQELTKERLVTAIRDVAHGKVEKTVTPEIAARMEGHVLGARLKIPGIKVLRLIGEGGMSRVYLASRESDDEPLVVKILRSEVMQDQRTLARFVEEYNLVERVSSRHVARVHAHGVQDNNAYLVMEFCEGGDLNKRLGNKALPPDEALRIFLQLMLALGDIHEQGILHRDLKPQNLMFRADGSLAIVDFGVAKHVDSIDRTNKGEILGTPRYMSPEQVQGRALDLRTDIYSAGVLLYQMMLGEHLFEGETAVEVALHHLNTPPPALPERLQQYQRLFDKLLEKDRDARFRNADEVIGYLTRKFFQDA
ncbi:MAG: protein kinase [Betaproteobacteria bacterium]|nr:protein kinase [Betaproteobacteria bacterium]MDH5222404.1 protein kinase [Betaproteobacteria bacterium]MDH5351496.1 protein kinase [Betaproteobacteria bacterium]